jgi:hypothetical protein
MRVIKGFERYRGIFRILGYIINIFLTPKKGGKLLVILERRRIRKSTEGLFLIIINVTVV